MAKISQEASRKKHRIIVMKKNAPLFELRPLSKDDMKLWALNHDLETAKASVRAGHVYSTKQVREMLNLEPLWSSICSGVEKL